MRRIFVVPVLLLVLSCKPQPGSPPLGVPGVIDCGVDAVKQNWPRVLPAVNKCLAAVADGDWFSCLMAVIGSAPGVTESVVACSVDSSGKSYADAGAHGDKLSATASARATEFVKQRGYRFAP